VGASVSDEPHGLRDRPLAVLCSDGQESQALAIMAGASGAGGEIERGGEMVGRVGHGSSRNLSMPGAAGFLILSHDF
jgi:hypothetical protein